MRFKDFGEVDKSIRLSDNLVSVSTTTVKDSAQLSYLQEVNKAHLEPWRTSQKPNDNPENYFFTIKYKDVIVGQVVLWRFKENPKSCSISYWVGLEFCGRGLATAAVNLITTYASTELKVKSLEARIHPNNFSSIRVAEKAGYKKSESLPNSVLTSAQAPVEDVYLFTA